MAAVKRWLKLLPALCALLAMALTPLAGMTGLGEAGEVVSDWAEAAVPEAAPELIPEEAEPEVIAAVPNAAPAGDIDPFREISCGDTRFVYSDEMLMGNAAALSTDLAKASVALAQAAYGSDGATITNTMIVETLTGSMGYVCDDYGSYSRINNLTIWDNDHVGFVIGKKEYGDYVIYCVPVKGTSENPEWHSDFRVGDPDQNDDFHEGFHKAALEVMAALQDCFEKDHHAKEKRIVWLTGHSRGAAVANIVAGLLTDPRQYDYADANHIFCYTFACPAVGLDSRVSAYQNIVNYNNAGDMIPLLPMERWHYKRYGVDITQNLNNCPNFLRNFRLFKKADFCGVDSEDDWLPLLNRIAPQPDSARELRDIIAYFLLHTNRTIDFTDFCAYMLSEYGYDMTKLGVKNLSKGTLLGAFVNTLDAVVESEEAMQQSLSEFWTSYNNAQDAEERSGVFNSYSALFRSMENLLDVTIDSVNAISPAEDKLQEWLIASRSMAISVYDLVGLLVDADFNLQAAVDHGHEGHTYILWINSWYCGYRSWCNTDITNPDVLDECRIDACTTIGGSAFENCTSLSSVHFNDNLRYIGESAFSGCHYISSLLIPDGVEGVGLGAFYGLSGLTSLTLPAQASRLNAFSGCTGLSAVRYTGGRTGRMPDRDTQGAYYQNSLEYAARSSLSTIQFDEGVTHIGDFAFYGDDIQTLTGGCLPESLESVGAYAFHGNGDLAIDGLPAGLTALGEYSFAGTGIADFEVPEGITAIPVGCFSGCDALTALELPGWIESIGYSAFSDCAGLRRVTLPIELSGVNMFNDCSGVQSIHYTVRSDGVMPDRDTQSAYYQNTLEYAARNSLGTIQFDEGVTHIGSLAFCANNIRTLVGGKLPDSLTSLGEWAFSGNANLVIEAIPAGVTEIPAYCFHDCGGITTLTIHSGIESIGAGAFSNCSGIRTLTLPIELSGLNTFDGCSGVQSIHYTVRSDGVMPDRDTGSNYYQNSLEYAARSSLSTIQFDEGVTHIGDFAFYGDDIQTLTGGCLPESLESVGVYAFHGNGDLAIDGLPAGLTSLGEYSFAESGITDFDMPAGITAIPAGCFSGCDALTALVIPNRIESIGYSAFSNCSGIRTLTLPIELSGLNMFDGCSGVQSIHYTVCSDGVMPDRDSGSAYYQNTLEYAARNSLGTIQFDEGVTHIGSLAFCANNIRTLVGGKLPDSLTSLGEWAFSGNANLVIEAIPAGVTAIPAYCFDNCAAITTLTIHSGIESIGVGAFSNCSGIRTLTLPIELTGAGAFNGCTGVQSIHYTARSDGVMPDRDNSGSNYYQNTLEYAARNSLTAVQFGEGVTHIGAFAFCGYPDRPMSFGAFPESLSSIGAYAFHGSRNLFRIDLPAGVTQIGDYAFGGTNAGVVNFFGDVPEIAARAFDGVVADACYFSARAGWTQQTMLDYGGTLTWIALDGPVNVVALPAGTDRIETEAFMGSGAQIVAMPEGMRIIRARAFANCENLRQVYIPVTVYSIARSAFSGCSPDMAIIGKKDSAAESYAKANGFRFIKLPG